MAPKSQLCFVNQLKRTSHFCASPAYLVYKTSGLTSCAVSFVGSKASISTQSMSSNEPVVSVDWLHANLKEPVMKVLDASWYMPNEQRNPLQEYQVAHIPGAIFFDVDGISDQTTKVRLIGLSQLPHMLPSEEAFAAAVSALGIENKDGMVVYDGKGIFSAARVWWMFRVFGHDKVWVLDGGLPRWRASGYDVESSASGDAILKASAASEAIEKVYHGQAVGPITFEAKFQPHLVWTLEQVKRNVEDKTHQHVDARSKARYFPFLYSFISYWHVRMISAEAPIIFAKACEMFILELTLRSWIHTEENKRRTLQKNDIAAAISRTDVFDFLVDIIPRDELKEEGLGITKATIPMVVSPADSVPYYYMPPQHAVGPTGMIMGKPVDQAALYAGQQPQPPVAFMLWTQQKQTQQQSDT
ncbi:hypothetical protein RHSIM_Rhsim05G0210500 [Rhododendron simsii]|uniref:3-mercaptopyruvate sulfurtransferase n=1 Tax=Rhododendron simsii TaxID=118357 RepID=A0A834H025_RHOSS|nr:hypothetical protein RHSIM_Rhsim05G0210500 [Rhododendron simsii]